MDACAVDLRANMLNLLAELTEDSQENILLGKNNVYYGHCATSLSIDDFNRVARVRLRDADGL